MTREEALEKLSRPAWDENTIVAEFEYIATKLGITIEELHSYLDAPNKSQRDYKNQEWFIQLGARTMIALGMWKGLVR
jgi:hypothetical protein